MKSTDLAGIGKLYVLVSFSALTQEMNEMTTNFFTVMNLCFNWKF